MSGADSAAEKEHEPTARRLEEARARGEVPRSADLATAAGYGGLLLAMAAGAGTIAAGTAGMALLGQADRLAPQILSGGGLPGGMVARLGAALAPLFLLPGAAALAAWIVQRGLTFAPEKLLPKLSRISPLAGFANKFGLRGLVEFAKSAVKLVLVSLALGVYLTAAAPEIVMAAALGPGQGIALLGRLMVGFVAVVLALTLTLAVIDLLWQRHDHLKRNRMSRQELVDETRNAEGDPQIRAQRRQKAMAIATNRMLADVPKADVVIVNPTHYAVALRWDRGGGRAPICVAKGVDEVAARIREAASAAGVPIHRDPPTARALFAAVPLGREIAPDQYHAVAAAIRFAEAMRRKARARGRR